MKFNSKKADERKRETDKYTILKSIARLSTPANDPVSKNRGNRLVRRAVAAANNARRNPSSYVPFAFDIYHREGGAHRY